MNPLLIVLPALGLVLGPRVWANRVLEAHEAEATGAGPAHRVARELLDRHGLVDVAVEATDAGDHYDPDARVVRLTHAHFDSDSLTAVTIAAHEVAHAIQHASGYPPFVWRDRLAQVAKITGGIGTVLLIAVPVAFLVSRRRLPPNLVSGTALGMIGTSTAVQLTALPTELNASFERALPMLRDGFVDDDQGESVHRILYACSLTYAGASLAGLLNLWPWLSRARVPVGVVAATALPVGRGGSKAGAGAGAGRRRSAPARTGIRGGAVEAALRRVARPIVRGLVRNAYAQHRARRVVRDPRGH